MPKVGSKHFAYTKKGAAAAKKHAAATGSKVTHATPSPRAKAASKRTYPA